MCRLFVACLQQKAGVWYPAGLRSNDFKGLFGYKVWLTIALLLGEGIYMLVKAFILGECCGG